ncbi:MAG: FtsW/RodA/SpoVE family cell cycle protein [Paramuribaculum sp.]|nr:FtsW/RodA/SpoVE family cell cycle protein [Paramuribaculum sp.]
MNTPFIDSSPSGLADSTTFKAANSEKSDTRADKHIWGIFLFLCLISIVELYSASSREVALSSFGVYGPVVRHGGMLIAGVCIVYLLQRVHYRNFLLWVPIFALVSVIMMGYVMINGEIVNGARRSITLLGVTLQPSEFLKFSAAGMIALIMSRTQIKGGVKDSGVIWAAGIVALFGGMLIRQGLTNTLLLMVISMSMMLIGGVPVKKFAMVILFYAAVLGIFKAVGGGSDDGEVDRSGTWQQRIERYMGDGKPKYEQKINAENRQEMYSFMAQANGGIAGVFPGNSREASRLPLAFSDYIFSIIVEDTGLIGGLVVLVLYLWLLARASAIASRCTRAFPALLVIGMAVMIVMQALFHIAIVTGVFPVSGQPLPLISKGGTSILVTSMAFGVMLSVSRFAVQSTKKAPASELAEAPEGDRAANPTQLL